MIRQECPDILKMSVDKNMFTEMKKKQELQNGNKLQLSFDKGQSHIMQNGY